MKTLITILIAGFLLASCYTSKDLQAERVLFKLEKIDTVFRAQGNLYMYTWYDTKNRLTYYEYRDEYLFTNKYMQAIVRK